jgi:hypothetical protein
MHFKKYFALFYKNYRHLSIVIAENHKIMALHIPLPEFIQELKALLTDDLGAVLKILKELLPENTEKHDQLLILQKRLKDINKDKLSDILPETEYRQAINRISIDTLAMINALEESDFEPNNSAITNKKQPKQGSVLYQIPGRMTLQKPSICKIRVAIHEDALLDEIVLDGNVHVRPYVEVSDRMSAELLGIEDKVFTIKSLNSKEQSVRDSGYTQWLFYVTPLIVGEHQLIVRISLMDFDPNTEQYVPREVSVLETVTIINTPNVYTEDTPQKTAGGRFLVGRDELLVPGHGGFPVESRPSETAVTKPQLQIPNPPFNPQTSPAQPSPSVFKNSDNGYDLLPPKTKGRGNPIWWVIIAIVVITAGVGIYLLFR